MSTLTADDMQTWHISYRDGRPDEDVRAAYPAKDGGLPGWITLKDWRHKVVAVIPETAAALIQRCPNDPDTVRGLAVRLVGKVRATGCLPRELEGATDGEAAKTEVALRTQALTALMRARISDMGDEGHEFYAYLRDLDPGDPHSGEILDITYQDGDRFGPRLHVQLSGYSPGRKVSDEELAAAVAAESTR